METLASSSAPAGGTWALPQRYKDMPPSEQAEALKNSVMEYLRINGFGARSVMLAAIDPPRTDTFQKTLDYLTTTQHIYVDRTTGSRDPVYFHNGRLAHPTGQKDLQLGRHQYVIRSYDDRLAGRTVTITQYAIQPSGETRPMSGIRLDWTDLPSFIETLSEVADGLHVYNKFTKAGGPTK